MTETETCFNTKTETDKCFNTMTDTEILWLESDCLRTKQAQVGHPDPGETERQTCSMEVLSK